MPSILCQWCICSRQLSSGPLDGVERPLTTWWDLLIRASTEHWLTGPRTTIVCNGGCNRTKWGSGGWWGTAFSWACTWLEWAAYPEHLNWQEQSEQAQNKVGRGHNRKLNTCCTRGWKCIPGERLSANFVWKSQASLSRYSSEITTTIFLHLHKVSCINVELI